MSSTDVDMTAVNAASTTAAESIDAPTSAAADDVATAVDESEPQAASDDENDDEDENAVPSGKKGGAKKKQKASPAAQLPTPLRVWSGIDLPTVRRQLCDALVTPSRQNAHIVKEGDSVIAYESRVSMSPIVMKKGAVYGNRFGTFHHSDMIGRAYGEKITARGKAQQKGWIVLLPFAPDLWTNSLTHRTQILYQADIAYVLFALDLKPGDVVFESGTGSGSLTTALATTVKPHGHVHTFEFNADRVQKAKIDFANNKLDEWITVRERDVVGHGFPMIEGGVNAVFLDLPAPWQVIESSHRALKHLGRLCSFSPCIEQVQRSCLKLDELGFSEIVTIEILLRSFEVQANHTFPVPQHQRKTFNATKATAAPATTETRKRSAEDDATESSVEKKLKTEDGSAVPASAALPATDAAEPAATAAATAAAAAAATPAVSTPAPVAAATTTPPQRVYLPLSLTTTKPYQLMRGHTGYLTFAVCNKF